MKRALPLCSLLLLSVAGCDGTEPLLELAEHVEASPTVVGDDGPESDDVCEVYCQGYRAQCGDSFTYASYDACEELCPYWETDEGDNLAAKCRLEALGAEAESTHAATCTEAGPDSEGCGTAYVTTCERYCDLYQDSCHGHGMGFESTDKCETWCGAETLEGAEGDTIECRIGWLTSPFAPPQCDRAGPGSTACE